MMEVKKITGAITVADIVQTLGYKAEEDVDIAKYDEMISNANMQLQLHTRQAGQLMYIIGQMMVQVDLSGKLGTELVINPKTGGNYNRQVKAVDYYSKKYGWGKSYVSGLMRIARNFSAEQADEWGASKLMQISSASRMKQLEEMGITSNNTLDDVKAAIKTIKKETKEEENNKKIEQYTPEQKEAIEKKKKLLDAGKQLLEKVRAINKIISKGEEIDDESLDAIQEALDNLTSI